MARPPKDPADKRTERLPYARLTVAERAAVEAMANAAGLTVAEFARRAVLGQKVMVRPRARPTDRAAAAYLTELGRIGINVNQIARRANASGNVPEQWPDVAAALMDLIDRIAREVAE